MNPADKTSATPAKPDDDAIIKNARELFESAWSAIEAELGRDKMLFPKELILLGGAPGSGKGTQTDFIRKIRDMACQPVVVSSLLNSPEARAIKASGGLVGDREVLNLLLRELMKPEYRNGTILDGFPRNKGQVEHLKLLVGKLASPPRIEIVALFVSEQTSVDRQLFRGRQIKKHNEEVRRTGQGALEEERPTDFDEPLAHTRYRVFMEQTWAAFESLKDSFNYHYIKAETPIPEVEKSIEAALK